MRSVAAGLSLVAALALPGPSWAQPSGFTAGVELLAAGLDRPTTIAHAGDGSGRLFVVEQRGRIRIWDGAAILPAPFLDIEALVDDAGNAQGLLGLAFHPDYESNGLFYVNYTRDGSPGLDRSVVARYRVSDGDPNLADPASAEVLFEIEQDSPIHNGDDLHFGPDGHLWFSTGDGGPGNDPNNNAQSPATLKGKILRLDVDVPAPPAVPAAAGPSELCGLGAAGYAAPPDNPYVGVAGACDEIWASGFRNPWRMSFDRATGDLFVGDVGQNDWEEVNLLPAGAPGGLNFGWRCWEGPDPGVPGDCAGPERYVFPILAYPHPTGCAVTGGYRYRGPAHPAMRGTYFYADYCTGTVWGAVPGCGGVWRETVLLDAGFLVGAFGEDEAGEIYLAAQASAPAGALYRLVMTELTRTIFASGFERPDLSDWSGCNGLPQPPAD